MANTMLIVFMILTALLLFTSMILSAMASDKAKGIKSDKNNGYTGTPSAESQYKCHKNSMYSALVTGVSVAVLLVILVVYIYTSKDELVSQAHGFIGQYVPQAPAK